MLILLLDLRGGGGGGGGGAGGGGAAAAAAGKVSSGKELGRMKGGYVDSYSHKNP